MSGTILLLSQDLSNLRTNICFSTAIVNEKVELVILLEDVSCRWDWIIIIICIKSSSTYRKLISFSVDCECCHEMECLKKENICSVTIFS